MDVADQRHLSIEVSTYTCTCSVVKSLEVKTSYLRLGEHSGETKC